MGKKKEKKNKNKRLTPTDVLDSPVALSFAFSRSVGLFSISCTSSFPSFFKGKRKITKRRAHQAAAAAAAVVFVFFFSLFFFGIFFHFLTPPLDGGGLSDDVCVFERRVFFLFFLFIPFQTSTASWSIRNNYLHNGEKSFRQ